MTLKEQILAAQDFRMEAVQVPEWDNVTVYVREMDGNAREEWYEFAVDGDGKARTDKYHARLLVFTLCDEKGQRLFSGEEIAALNAKHPKVLARLYEVAADVNALRAKDVDDAVKNS